MKSRNDIGPVRRISSRRICASGDEISDMRGLYPKPVERPVCEESNLPIAPNRVLCDLERRLWACLHVGSAPLSTAILSTHLVSHGAFHACAFCRRGRHLAWD